MNLRAAAQLFRVLILAGLLFATVSPVRSLEVVHAGSLRELGTAGDVWRSWVPLVVIALVFAAGLFVGRDQPSPRWVLAVEAAVAAVLGFVPPSQWTVWLGSSAGDQVFGSVTSAVGFVQPLALVWFVVAVRHAVQLRANPTAP